MNGFNEHLRLSSWNYRILELPQEKLLNEIETFTRETIIEWLLWNDPNGIYTDEMSLKEFGNVMSRDEGVEIMLRQIEENRL
ncbi:hypothetical protein [Daejeonella sp.]|uniref:hypothetical protein n=1 Tax=Daejeonella sp. TaxID=2805397 RepID=UPI0030BE6269